MLLFLVLAACAGEEKEASEPAPTVEWLVPADGGTTTAGDVSCSLIVENFALVSPALHNEGEPIGYLEISLDGVVALETEETTPTLSIEAGEHTLAAALIYADGDEVLASGDLLCEEEGEGCEPVVAEISFTAE